MGSELDAAVACPTCGVASDLAEWLDLGDRAAPPPHDWLWSRCPACGKNGEFTLSSGMAEVGNVDGFPGPCFMPFKRHDIAGLEVTWSAHELRLRFKGRRWTVRRGPWRGA